MLGDVKNVIAIMSIPIGESWDIDIESPVAIVMPDMVLDGAIDIDILLMLVP